MSARFGRNQRRKMRDQIAQVQISLKSEEGRHAKTHLENDRLHSTVQRLKNEHRAFVAQCVGTDQTGYRITIDFEAIERMESRTIELRTRLLSRGREQLAYAELLDPFRDPFAELHRDKENLIKLISAKVAYELAGYIQRKGWK